MSEETIVYTIEDFAETAKKILLPTPAKGRLWVGSSTSDRLYEIKQAKENKE